MVFFSALCPKPTVHRCTHTLTEKTSIDASLPTYSVCMNDDAISFPSIDWICSLVVCRTQEWVEIIEPTSREKMFANPVSGEILFTPPEGAVV